MEEDNGSVGLFSGKRLVIESTGDLLEEARVEKAELVASSPAVALKRLTLLSLKSGNLDQAREFTAAALKLDTTIFDNVVIDKVGDELIKACIVRMHLATVEEALGHEKYITALLTLERAMKIDSECLTKRPIEFPAEGDISTIFLAGEVDMDDVAIKVRSLKSEVHFVKHDDANLRYYICDQLEDWQVNQLDLFIEGVSTDPMDLLHLSACLGCLHALRYFVEEKSMTINLSDKIYSRTPVMFASMSGHLDVVKYLHSLGGRLTDLDNDGWVTLSLAFSYGHIDIARYLMREGDSLTEMQLSKLSQEEKIQYERMLLENDKDGQEYLDKFQDAYKSQRFIEAIVALNNGLKCDEHLFSKVLFTLPADFHCSEVSFHKDDKKHQVLKEMADYDLGVCCIHQDSHTETWALDFDKRDFFKMFNQEDITYGFGCVGVETILAALGCLPALRYCLETKWISSPRLKRMFRKSPLVEASRNGHLSVVKYLVESKISLQSAETKANALKAACGSGHLSIVKYLASKNARVDGESLFFANGETPLTLACNSGHFDIVKFLISKGAGVGFVNDQEETLLHSAAAAGHVNIVRYLYEEHGLSLEGGKKYGDSVLSHAASRGRLDVVQYLVSIGADVHQTSTDGTTALMEASSGGNLEVVEYLVECGANVNEKGRHGKTALMMAVEYNHISVVSFLIEQKADPNLPSGIGVSPLLEATTSTCNLKMVKLLVESGADVNVATYNKTPLMGAVWQGSQELVEYLLSKGAEVNQGVGNDKSVLVTAACHGCLAILKYLITNGLKVDNPNVLGEALGWASQYGHFEMVLFLVEELKANINYFDSDSESILYRPIYALSYKDKDSQADLVRTIAYLISRGLRLTEEEISLLKYKEKELYENLLKKIRDSCSLQKIVFFCVSKLGYGIEPKKYDGPIYKMDEHGNGNTGVCIQEGTAFWANLFKTSALKSLRSDDIQEAVSSASQALNVDINIFNDVNIHVVQCSKVTRKLFSDFIKQQKLRIFYVSAGEAFRKNKTVTALLELTKALKVDPCLSKSFIELPEILDLMEVKVDASSYKDVKRFVKLLGVKTHCLKIKSNTNTFCSDVIDKNRLSQHGLDLQKVSVKYLSSSVLHQSAYLGLVEVVKYLLEVKCEDVNEVDKNGKTALMLAIEKGHHGVVKYLLSQGATGSKELLKKVTTDLRLDVSIDQLTSQSVFSPPLNNSTDSDGMNNNNKPEYNTGTLHN